MTTFKAVDGWTFPFDIKEISEGQDGIVDGRLHQRGVEDMKCTIIPGHWAAKIESGGLLTEEEMQEIHNEWVLAGGVSWSVFLCRFIARKLRGEA